MSNFGKHNVWAGGEGTLADVMDIEPTGFVSPRMVSKPKRIRVDRVKTYLTDRGFGFITPADGGKDIFFRKSDVADGDVRVGAAVTYTTIKTARGVRAKNIYIIN